VAPPRRRVVFCFAGAGVACAACGSVLTLALSRVTGNLQVGRVLFSPRLPSGWHHDLSGQPA
jgi:hypothetical protein